MRRLTQLARGLIVLGNSLGIAQLMVGLTRAAARAAM